MPDSNTYSFSSNSAHQMTAHRYVFVTLGSCLILSWTLVIAVDFLSVGGLRDRLTTIFWMSLFANDRPIEWVQWYTLGASAGPVSVRRGAIHKCQYRSDARACRVLADHGGRVYLMLVEDAGDVRHTMLRIVEQQIGSPAGAGLLSKGIEFSYFAAISLIPLYALLRHGTYVRASVVPFGYVICGFVLYGIAAFSSATCYWWGGWYAPHLGSAIETNTGLVFPESGPPERFPQWFVDAFLEESIELLGAMFFLAAVVFLAQWVSSASFSDREYG